MHSNDFVHGDWWLYFSENLLFPQNHCQARQSLTFPGMSPAVWGIEATGAKAGKEADYIIYGGWIKCTSNFLTLVDQISWNFWRMYGTFCRFQQRVVCVMFRSEDACDYVAKLSKNRQIRHFWAPNF